MAKMLLVWMLMSAVCIQMAFGNLYVEDDEDIIRKSIVYDKNTPDVFYCPQEKPEGMNNMLVKARPLSKLCEYKGGDLPEGYKSDCYGNVDETVYACKEKRRIMKRKYPPGMEILDKYLPLTRKKRAELYDMSHPRRARSDRRVITRVVTSSKKSVTSMRGMVF
ncbi:Protein translocase subunit SecA 2 [Orchesella cincta]|uniref:Protein translocase subunit SecA 2 n=1 Tax=Orchesella cincta TaxID=48709 RepID=A0A1D2NAN5_ORCCI|nr:Protein translocase subunit SecA 2 [Orchesella cincta]